VCRREGTSSGIRLTDGSFVTFTETWEELPHESNAEAASDLCGGLKVERPSVAGKLKESIADLVGHRIRGSASALRFSH